MNLSPEMKEFLQHGHKEYLPHVAIDCAIFGYHEQQLKILLIKHRFLKGWCLPGGFIKRTEKLVEAANRIVMERTAIGNLYLQQFKSYGDPSRSKYEEFNAANFTKLTGVKLGDNSWLMDHFISVGFYALTDFSSTVPKTDFISEDCAWFDIETYPKLLLDHGQMVIEARETLRFQLHHFPIGYSLLQKKFTLSEIHALYQSLLGKKLDVSNFSKKLLALGIIKKLNEKRGIGPHRSPHLYSFDKKKYDMALKQGLDLS